MNFSSLFNFWEIHAQSRDHVTATLSKRFDTDRYIKKAYSQVSSHNCCQGKATIAGNAGPMIRALSHETMTSGFA